MLPSASRMRRGDEFAEAIRRGRRAGRPSLVAHFSRCATGMSPRSSDSSSAKPSAAPSLRNQVKRQLRHLMRARLHLLPRGSLLVVRANPPAASARSEHLAADLDVALDRLSGGPPTTDGHDSRAARIGGRSRVTLTRPTPVARLPGSWWSPIRFYRAFISPLPWASVPILPLLQRIWSGGDRRSRGVARGVVDHQAYRPMPSLPPRRVRSRAPSTPRQTQGS